MYFNTVEHNAEAFVKHSFDRIQTIFQPSEFQINFKVDNVVLSKPCYILAEKLNDRDMLQIRIAEKMERRMYTSTINIQFFNILKINQSLHVTFMGFVENLLQILQECQKQHLQISIVQRSKENETLLQFYEMNSFKNLIHLSLPIEEATLPVINYHLNRMIDKHQDQNNLLESTIKDLRNQLNMYNDNLIEIKKENNKLREDLMQQKQIYSRKQKADLDEMQMKMKVLMEAKESDESHYKKIISQLQSKVDLLSLEKTNAVKEKCDEIKKFDNLHKEFIQLKAANTNVKQSKENLVKELDSLKHMDERYKYQINNLSKKVSENDAKILKLEKENSGLKAELQAEKKLCHAKRNAFEVASEEISKANDIISKQSVELSKLKKTIDWRTEVALQQEMTIEKKEKAIRLLKQQILDLENEFKQLRTETSKFPLEITSMKQLAESLEKTYQNKILELNAMSKS